MINGRLHRVIFNEPYLKLCHKQKLAALEDSRDFCSYIWVVIGKKKELSKNKDIVL